MTELLYQTDSYLREADATVIGHTEVNGVPAVALDRTVLYPGGGGQPSDTGTLIWNGGQAAVIRAAIAAHVMFVLLLTAIVVPHSDRESIALVKTFYSALMNCFWYGSGLE